MVGEGAADQRFLNQTGLGVGAVEYRHLIQRHTPAEQLGNLTVDVVGFFPVRFNPFVADRFPDRIFGPEGFPFPAEILFDHLPCRRQNCGGGAVILLQPDDGDAGKIFLKLQDVADVSPAPGVDGLVVVTDNAEIFTLPRQQADEGVLHRVGVLVFVHQQPLKPFPVEGADLREAGQESDGLDHHIAEIEGVALFEALLIGGVNFHHPLVVGVTGGDRADILREKATVFKIVNPSGNRFGGKALFVQVHFGNDVLQKPFAVAVVINGKRGLKTEVVDVAAEDAAAGGVKGGDERQVAPAQQFADPLCHFPRRLVGEGNGHDVPGAYPPLPDQVGDAVGDDAGFARSGAGQDQQRPLAVQHSFLLGGVEVFQ